MSALPLKADKLAEDGMSALCQKQTFLADNAVGLMRPIFERDRAHAIRLEQCAKQLGRLLDHVRGLGLEAVHQKAVALVVVEDPP